MSVLTSVHRKELERAVGQGRALAEAAARVAVSHLGVADKVVAAHLSEDERVLRRALRARARQLGDRLETAEVNVKPCGLLIAEVAYEQWHRLLFARFLEANGLLMHPKFEAPVSISECEELAADLGEPDGWSVAARFASEIVPGVFKPSDPCAQVRLAREDLLALERVVTSLPPEVFLAEDALGWVYQYWQSQAKKDVNDSGRRVGGADLSPVTQLFTEHYMVRFLLENSLGAWWAGRHPGSPLLDRYEYLERLESGSLTISAFEDWPDSAAQVTVIDPCCGSGHFLVAAFGMLWRMRAEEEGLSPSDAQDAVLRDNVFGLELDPRCTQIAVFALALEAWKQGGYRQLPVPNLTCSGIPAKIPLTEWTALANGDYKVESALARLHALFKDADTFGSLIDPVRAAEDAGLESVDWTDIQPLVQSILRAEVSTHSNPESQVIGDAMTGIVRSADLLSRKYTLIATNPPFLGRSKQSNELQIVCEFLTRSEGVDLATAFVQSMSSRLEEGGSICVVLPDTWRFIPSYSMYRREFLRVYSPILILGLGSRAFRAQLYDYPIGLLIAKNVNAKLERHDFVKGDVIVDADNLGDFLDVDWQCAPIAEAGIGASSGQFALLGAFARPFEGLSTGDGDRFTRKFWEQLYSDRWECLQMRPTRTQVWGGTEEVFLWEEGQGELAQNPGARIQGMRAWNQKGVLVERQKSLRASLYTGKPFFKTSVVIVPTRAADLPALWAFCSSDEYGEMVRSIDPRVGIATSATVKVPFDVERWREVAAESDPLPDPFATDPTQWLFCGVPAGSDQPLQVAVARLLGFRWPDQDEDSLDELVDDDGIVCLPAVAGERPAADRVREVLSRSYGGKWSGSVLDQLLVAVSGTPGDLAKWLAEGFFKDHCRVFQNRPFIWHVWDGRKDGFSALINYHRLNRSNLQRLTYTTLGWWIDRQRADADSGVVGADLRLASAMELQLKLEQILEGEPPFDVFVRWKPVHKQPLGWNPDLDDGVRLNVRPFVEAGVLRSKFTVQWKKDRGTNPDGSERHNDVHMLLAEKRAARGDA